ncbi:MAG: iron-containing alcohol dehydrogenase [Clostridia bacterium]|nr:iron-containing alcohol dehydrogenase [Clostridia bacterium]
MDYIFTPKEVRCSCTLTHSHYTRFVAAGEGLIAKINEAVADVLKAGHIALCYAQDDEGTAATVTQVLEASDYKITRLYYAEGTEPSPEAAEDIIACADSVRLIIFIGDGEFCDVAKYAAEKRGIEWMYIPTSPDISSAFCGNCIFGFGVNIEAVRCKPPISVIIDDDIMRRSMGREQAAGYGNILGHRFKCYEYEYAVRIKGEDYCLAGVRRLGMITDKFFSLSSVDACVIARVAAKIGLNNQMYKLNRLCNSDYLAQVIAAHTDEGRALGENMPIAVYVLTGLYRAMLSEKMSTLAVPADKIEAINELCKLCGCDKISAINRMDIGGGREKEWYMLSEYRREIGELLHKYTDNLSSAARVFRRLYSDAGYWLGKYLAEDKAVEIGKMVLTLQPDSKKRQCAEFCDCLN